ncbi:MAG: SDR family NAD(P)-dependent oxidoreductase [Phycisphaerae bacterium]
MTEMRRYETALITGASAGLGEEFAMQLAGRVEHMVLTARREDRLLELAERIGKYAPGARVSVIAADLSKEEDRLRLIGEMAAQGIVPDLLVNNAGLGDYGEFATAEWPRLEAMLRVNVEALTHLAYAVLPGMIARRRGAIVNVSSIASLMPIPDFAVYAATKAYVTNFSEALRIELREHGIPVLALCPGPVRTEFGAVARRADGGRDMPGRQCFYASKEQVVSEGLAALERGWARVFPSWKIALSAAVISVAPMVLMRLALSTRPRK